MTEPMFRTLISGVPFRPFTIVTDAGGEYRVEHPENYWIAPNMPVVHVAWENYLTAIEISHIIAVRHEQAIA